MKTRNIVGIFRRTGLDRSEIVALKLSDYDLITNVLSLQGKCNRTRIIPIEDKGAYEDLMDWLHHRGYDDGPLFTHV